MSKLINKLEETNRNNTQLNELKIKTIEWGEKDSFLYGIFFLKCISFI